MTSPSTNAIDELFEMTAPASNATDTTTPTSPEDTATENANATDTQNTDSSNGTDNADDGVIYPKVLVAYPHDSFPADEAPTGTATLPEFAGLLTLHLLQKNGMDPKNIIDKPVIYNSARAKRHPLPVVLVWAKDAEGDQSKATAYIPIEEGFKAWEERPARGEGATTNTTSSTRPIEDLFKDAAGKRKDLEAMTARRDKLNERIAKATTQVEKYGKWLSDRGKSWDDVTAWVKSSDEAAQAAEENGPSEPDTDETTAGATQ